MQSTQGVYRGSIINMENTMRNITFFVCFLATIISEATHLRAGQITLKQVSELTYTVTLKIFTNTGSFIRFGDGELNFGDGSSVLITPTLDNSATPDPKIGVVNYSITHTFPGVGTFVISYMEPNLDAGIINIANSVETRFYVEAKISLVSGRNCSSPEFLTEQFSEQPIGKAYAFSNQAIDKNDYRLTYQLASPLAPGKASFTVPEGMSINYYNGLVEWDTKFSGALVTGEYLFGVRVTQYDNGGKEVGYVMRTFQILLADVSSEISTMTSITDPNRKVIATGGKSRTIRAVVTDNLLSNEIKWSVFYDNKIASNVSFTQYDSLTGAKKMKVGLLMLNPTAAIVRDNPYSITLRGTSITAAGQFSKDISYLFFTKDIELPSVITAVKDKSKKQFQAYPNPFSHFIRADEMNGMSECEFILTDIAGQVVFSSKGKMINSIETSDLAPGMYVLQMKNGEGAQQQKLVKR